MKPEQRALVIEFLRNEAKYWGKIALEMPPKAPFAIDARRKADALDEAIKELTK